MQANPGRGGDVSRPIYISGKVVMADGSPVVPSIAIQRVCSGIPQTVAYTDSKGGFSFRSGDRNMVVTDAADAGSGSARSSGAGGFGSAQSAGGGNTLAADPFGNRMMNCELRASMAGYTSDAVNLFNRHSSDSANVGQIALHRIAGVEGASISLTAMMAPEEREKSLRARPSVAAEKQAGRSR